MKVAETIKAFDLYLADRKLKFEAVVIGGTALNLLGVVSRETKDCDILDPQIPESVIKAATEFKKSRPELSPNWLNNGPDSLKKNLPQGWNNRLQILFKGKAILFHTLARTDLLKTKLFAYCDRGIDLPDCRALQPMRDELNEALSWVQYQDANVDWPNYVKRKIQELAIELGYEL